MISKEHIKHIRSLHQKKFRELHQQFIIEGSKMVEEAIKRMPEKIIGIYGTSEKPDSIDSRFDYYKIDNKTLQQISNLKNPQPQLAVLSYFSNKVDYPEFILALDTIQDPGNMGTILRLCSWFGVSKIVASKETVEQYNPKVIQASMGAIFTVDVEYLDLKSFLQNTNLPIYGALLEGDNIYLKKEIKTKGILLMGNEGNGISKDLIPLITHPITIPQFGEGESLNVAMATAILLSEFSRPR